SAAMDYSVPSNTPLGPKNIAVNRGTDASILTGAVVITNPAPTIVTVTPSNGPVAGGTDVTIPGSNFRDGAQVYFGGLAAPAVTVVDSSTIVATTPANSPSITNVVVINTDGTWAAASRAFTYNALPPAITAVTPLSGAPATVVTIEGDNF